MTLTAATIIEQARGRSPVFDPTRHPNKVVLQFLSAKVRELHGRVTKIDPEAVRSDVSAALPLADHAAGIDLGTTRHVVEVVAFDTRGSEYPVSIIPATHRLDDAITPACCWQIGSRLYLTSPASLWQRMVRVVAAVVGVPGTLTGVADTIALPDAAELALVEACAAFMARRAPADAKLDVRGMIAYATDCEAAFLEDVANRLTGQVIQTRDVYRP